ncbi:hypothetical protein QJS66_09105 [Kocuria rhizophila]|nr:hypothetical protein QJS66_09105 [Kocuria rhizophila]
MSVRVRSAGRPPLVLRRPDPVEERMHFLHAEQEGAEHAGHGQRSPEQAETTVPTTPRQPHEGRRPVIPGRAGHDVRRGRHVILGRGSRGGSGLAVPVPPDVALLRIRNYRSVVYGLWSPTLARGCSARRSPGWCSTSDA